MSLSSLNIYPLNKENLEALLNYFCPNDEIGDIDWILKQNQLKLNQIEFALKMALPFKDVVFNEVGGSGNTISNLLSYACAALFNFKKGEPSRNRKRITALLLEKIRRYN